MRRLRPNLAAHQLLLIVLTASELERELSEIGRLAYRLMPPLNQRPHLFHESKAELIEAIGRLRERLRGVAPALSFTSPSIDSGVRSVRQARGGSGRDIPVERRGRIPSKRELAAARSVL